MVAEAPLLQRLVDLLGVKDVTPVFRHRPLPAVQARGLVLPLHARQKRRAAQDVCRPRRLEQLFRRPGQGGGPAQGVRPGVLHELHDAVGSTPAEVSRLVIACRGRGHLPERVDVAHRQEQLCGTLYSRAAASNSSLREPVRATAAPAPPNNTAPARPAPPILKKARRSITASPSSEHIFPPLCFHCLTIFPASATIRPLPELLLETCTRYESSRPGSRCAGANRGHNQYVRIDSAISAL